MSLANIQGKELSNKAHVFQRLMGINSEVYDKKYSF